MSDSLKDKIIQDLAAHLDLNGEFPVHSEVLLELSKLLSIKKHSPEKWTKIILDDPTLGLRILDFFNEKERNSTSLVENLNSSSIAEIYEFSSGLNLSANFFHNIKEHNIFSYSILRLFGAGLAYKVLSQSDDLKFNQDTQFILQLSQLGLFLICYYYPELAQRIWARALDKKISIDEASYEILSVTNLEFTRALIAQTSLTPNLNQALMADLQRNADLIRLIEGMLEITLFNASLDRIEFLNTSFKTGGQFESQNLKTCLHKIYLNFQGVTAKHNVPSLDPATVNLSLVS